MIAGMGIERGVRDFGELRTRVMVSLDALGQAGARREALVFVIARLDRAIQ